MFGVTRVGLTLLLSGIMAGPVFAEDELQKIVNQLLAPPTITAERGFTARVLVPPGQLYDPLWMLPQDGAIWLNDDGGEEGETGSRLVSLDTQGNVSVVIGVDTMLPVVGYDIAPEGFGDFAGQIFTLAQAKVAMEGAVANHVIQRVDPKTDYATSVFCTLPEIGEGQVSGFGAQARFGPVGSPFAEKFFAIAILNRTVYQVTADGKCTPFVTFDADAVGSPFGMTFTPDGKTMLVSVMRGDLSAPTGGAIVQVSPTGQVADKPWVKGLKAAGGLAFAPEGFGSYGGQLFITDTEAFGMPVPLTQAMTADGKVYRVTADGKLHLVASGLVNPAGVGFVDGKLWVTDINGDFIAGKREMPDGFVVQIEVR